jgi:hypothetical protein
VKSSPRSLLRIAAVGVIVVASTGASACKRARHANGDVSRNWTPPQQDQYMGIPVVEVQGAIRTRLAAAPPPPVTADEWKHVKKLYASFNQGLLWVDDKGMHHPRVSAMLNALASADSDGLKLDAYPLAELARTLGAIDAQRPTAAELAEADVMLSAAFATYGETMLTGQVQPASLGQAWHINPLEEKVDSALSLTLREDDFAAGLVRMRP